MASGYPLDSTGLEIRSVRISQQLKGHQIQCLVCIRLGWEKKESIPSIVLCIGPCCVIVLWNNLACVFSCSAVSDSLWPHRLQPLQAPLPTEFSRQEYWSRLLFPSPGDVPNPEIEPASLSCLHWQEDSLPLCHLKEDYYSHFTLRNLRLVQIGGLTQDTWTSLKEQDLNPEFLIIFVTDK